MCVCVYLCVKGGSGVLDVDNLITPAKHGKFIHEGDYCVSACVLRDQISPHRSLALTPQMKQRTKRARGGQARRGVCACVCA